MNRPSILSRANSLKGIAIAWSWVVGYALPTLAQKPAAGQVVAAEIKGLPTHENSGFLEAVFTGINYLTGIALAGVLIFGLIWLLKRRNIIEDAETAEGEDSTSGAGDSATGQDDAKKDNAAKEETVKEDTETKEAAETKESSDAEQKADEKAAD
ncbi:hypothetical protein BH11CYA1_BH11CYA1_29370 [soil metagenome]